MKRWNEEDVECVSGLRDDENKQIYREMKYETKVNQINKINQNRDKRRREESK